MEISAKYLWILALCLILVAQGAAGQEGEIEGRPLDAPSPNEDASEEKPVVTANGNADESIGGPLIEKICKRAQDGKLCMEVLSASPESKHGNMKDLAMRSLKVAATNAKEILLDVKRMIDDPSLDPGIQQGLADCKETLLDAQGQIADSVAAILANSNNDAQTWLKAALAAIDTCDASIPGDDDILSVRSMNFRKLCSIALAISETMVAQKGT